MLDFSRFETLTFDCYGTLINWEDGILRCLRHILKAHDREADDATILRLYGDFEARAEQGEADRHHDDERHGHGEVPAQPDPDLLEHEV